MVSTKLVSSIIFREQLYPRLNTSPETVQRYAEDLSVLPPIEINQKNELIDGWHRWTAHKKANGERIAVKVTPTKNDAEILELAVSRNAAFGLQLSTNDKKSIAQRIYRETAPDERGAKKRRLAELLSMSYDTINRWLGRIDKDQQEQRNAAVLDLFLQCYTQEEIVESTGSTRDMVRDVLGKIGKYEIPPIPGQFSDGAPGMDAADSMKQRFEKERQQKIVAHNRANADHESDFALLVFECSSPADGKMYWQSFINGKRRPITQTQLIDLLNFDIHWANFERNPLRRHHKTEQIFTTEVTPLGFVRGRFITERS